MEDINIIGLFVVRNGQLKVSFVTKQKLICNKGGISYTHINNFLVYFDLNNLI